MLIVFLSFVLFWGQARADVVLVPGHIVGTVQIGTETIQSMHLIANNADDRAEQKLSPNVSSASYDLTVNVPTGTTPTYTVQAINVRTNNLDNIRFSTQSVIVNETTPATVDFIIDNPGYMSPAAKMAFAVELFSGCAIARNVATVLSSKSSLGRPG